MITNAEFQIKCLMVEAIVKMMVMKGITNDHELVAIIDDQFHPETEWEQEMYSEAIIYAKQGVLN